MTAVAILLIAGWAFLLGAGFALTLRGIAKRRSFRRRGRVLDDMLVRSRDLDGEIFESSQTWPGDRPF